VVADNRDPLEKRLDADEMATEQKEADLRAIAKDAGRQRGKGIFNLLRRDLSADQHEALVDGMIESLVEQREVRKREQLERLPKKTYRVWANQPFWCEVEAPNEEEAKRIAVEKRAWECCWENNDPSEDDIYDVQEMTEESV
jgi:hypothetical protein